MSIFSAQGEPTLFAQVLRQHEKAYVMVALKGKAIQAFIRKPDQNISVILVYGPDSGLVSETILSLIKSLKIPLEDPFALVRMGADQLASSPSMLNDELATVSMFGGQRLIWVKAQGRDITASIADVLEQDVGDSLVVVEAGDLKPTSALRKLTEKHALARALPCYADDAAALGSVIAERVKEAGKTIEQDAVALLLTFLGKDRQLTLQELDKLLLYCGDRSVVTLGDVEVAIADTSQLSFDQMIDAVALGNIKQASACFYRLLADGHDCGVLVGMILRHFHLLARLRSDADQGVTISQSIKAARPPIFFKRHGLIERQVSRWSLKALEAITSRIAEVEASVRVSPLFGEVETERLLFAIAMHQNRPRQVGGISG